MTFKEDILSYKGSVGSTRVVYWSFQELTKICPESRVLEGSIKFHKGFPEFGVFGCAYFRFDTATWSVSCRGSFGLEPQSSCSNLLTMVFGA